MLLVLHTVIYTSSTLYCMKPPNIKAPKCTLYSFIIQGQRSQALNGLATAHCRSVLYFPYSALFSSVKGHKRSPVLPRLIASIVGGSLLRRAHFESLRAAEAKNAATINHLMSKCTLFSFYYPGSKVTKAHRSCHGSFRAS